MFEGKQLSIFDLMAMENEDSQQAVEETPVTDEQSKLLADVDSLVRGVQSNESEDEIAQSENGAVTESSEDTSIVPAATKSNKKTSKAPKSSVTQKSPATTKPVIESVPLGTNADWKVRYAGTTYYLNLLFEEEIINSKNSVTLEEIREKLVTTEFCIELSPKRVHWEAEEAEQLLVLICKGQSKGGF